MAGYDHLDPVGKLPIVVVLQIEELHRVRVRLREFAPLETFLDLGQPEAGSAQVRGKDHNDERLDPALVQDAGHRVAEELHQQVLLVIDGVVRIVPVDSAGVELPVQPRSLFCGRGERKKNTKVSRG